MTDKWTADLMNAIGITNHARIIAPVVESSGTERVGQFFIKFMSDGGGRDNEQADAFHRWLDTEGVGYDKLTERAFHVNKREFEAAFGQQAF